MLTNGITWILPDLSAHLQNELAALSTDIVVAAGWPSAWSIFFLTLHNSDN